VGSTISDDDTDISNSADRPTVLNRMGAVLASFAATIGYCVRPGGVGEPDIAKVSPRMVTVWGLVYGLLLCGVFAWSWRFFGDIYFSEYSRLRLVPIALVVLFNAIVGFKQLLGLAVTVDRLAEPNRELAPETVPPVKLPGQLAIILAILLKFTALLAMPYHSPWWPGDWRRYFNRFYPMMHYRVLILFGLWGRTGLLIAAATGPTSSDIDNQDRIFRRKLAIRSLLANLVVTFLVTTVYFSSWRNRAIGMLVSFIIFLLVYLVSMLLSWRTEGHDRHSMFACAEISELLLLFSYLAVAKYL